MLDLTRFFEKAGETLTLGLRNNISRQMDINGSAFSPIAPSTAMARQRRKGLGRGLSVRLQTGATKNRVSKGRNKLTSSLHVNTTRLLDTRKFITNAFRYVAGPLSLEVYVPEEKYDEKVTYWDIVRYNNEGSPDVNPRIRRPPLVWPNTDADVAKMKAMQKVQADFERAYPEMRNMLFGAVQKHVEHKVKIGL